MLVNPAKGAGVYSSGQRQLVFSVLTKESTAKVRNATNLCPVNITAIISDCPSEDRGSIPLRGAKANRNVYVRRTSFSTVVSDDE